MVFNTAFISLLLVTVMTMGQECPPNGSTSNLQLEPTSSAVNKGYAAIQRTAEAAMQKEGGVAGKTINQRFSCSLSAAPDEAAASFISKRWLSTRTCEACPPTVYYLRRFLRYCYVVFPNRQWLRFVRCPSRCRQPCWCSNSRCVASRYHLSWVWAYCTRNTSFGFSRGLNYRWLWLPQDCQCREFSTIG